MIRITLLSGPRAGQERSGADTERLGISPLELVSDLARKGYRWEIDFSAASEQEALEWGLADLVGRVLAAALMGRSVRFMGRRWSFADTDFASNEAREMIDEIEDAIVCSGRNVGVLADDRVSDLVIGVRGYEPGH